MSSENSNKKKDEAEYCSLGDLQIMCPMMDRCRAGKGRFKRSFMTEAMKSQSCWCSESEATGGNDGETKSCC